MGGFFAVVSQTDCVNDLFYGTDYHSHLGNQRGGLLVTNGKGFTRFIHDIRNDPFRAKFQNDMPQLQGNMGIGSISDFEDQPLIISCKHGRFGICTVGRINNLATLRQNAFQNLQAHFAEIAGDDVNPSEIVASLVSQKSSFAEGIRYAQDQIEGSCSMLLLTEEGVYAVRDRYGRTPVLIGEKDGSYAATFESCALHNLDYRICHWLGPGEAVLLPTHGKLRTILPAQPELHICSFLWVYYGFPASAYENINVEAARYRCGELLADDDKNDLALEFDAVAGVPDSGTAHALGYAGAAGIPYRRSYVKYTPTWSRSFTSDTNIIRLQVAKMKLIPITDFIRNQRLLFCEDSIVRGTQLKDTFARLPEFGAREVHIRSACPPILYSCKYLNFSPSRSPLELIARRAVHALEGDCQKNLSEYSQTGTAKYNAMVEYIRQEMGFTSLKYQSMENLVKAIGLPKSQLCTYCLDGCVFPAENCATESVGASES